MAYTTIDNPELFHQTLLHAEDDSSFTFAGSEDMQPDLIWNKNRESANYDHHIVDSVRGITKMLRVSTNIPEFTATDVVTAIGSDGFTVGNDDNGYFSSGTDTQVSWCWKAGTSFSNDASATGVGSIDSSGSITTDAGISIIKYTGAGTGTTTTIAHGLGAVPEMYVVKSLDSTGNWQVYHHKMSSDPKTDYIQFDNDAAPADYTFWGDTAPTSTVFTVKDGNDVNESGEEYFAWIFKAIKGYSRFGKYKGNGNNDGTFAYTGFRPAWIMIKNVSQSQNWYIYDIKRSPFNPADDHIYADLDNAEVTGASFVIDILSNGFKMRNSNDGWNGNGEDYIYMAFAESPIVNSNKLPNNAR